MAPLAPNSTPRFRAHYTTLGKQHTVQFRSALSPASFGSLVAAYLGAFNTTCADITLDFVDWAPTGSDIFNPVTTGVEGTTFTGGTGVPSDAAVAYVFSGRTSGGRRVRLAQFGALFVTTDYRIAAGEASDIDAVIAILVGAGSDIIGIDGLTPVWHTDATVKPNDHWVKVLRG